MSAVNGPSKKNMLDKGGGDAAETASMTRTTTLMKETITTILLEAVEESHMELVGESVLNYFPLFTNNFDTFSV